MNTWKTSKSITAGAVADQLETEVIAISVPNVLLLSPIRNILYRLLAKNNLGNISRL